MMSLTMDMFGTTGGLEGSNLIMFESFQIIDQSENSFHSAPSLFWVCLSISFSPQWLSKELLEFV